MNHHTVYRGSTAVSHFMNDVICYTAATTMAAVMSIKWNCTHTTFEGGELSTS